MAKFNPPNTEPRPAPPADNAEARWRHLTEALIFAAPYGTTEYLTILDRTGRPYNREEALRRHKILADAIATEYEHLPIRLLRCHAANNSTTFRLRYGHALPKRPAMIQVGRRPGGTPEERQARADQIAATMVDEGSPF